MPKKYNEITSSINNLTNIINTLSANQILTWDDSKFFQIMHKKIDTYFILCCMKMPIISV